MSQHMPPPTDEAAALAQTDLTQSLRAKAQHLLNTATQTPDRLQRHAILLWSYSLLQQAYWLEGNSATAQESRPISDERVALQELRNGLPGKDSPQHAGEPSRANVRLPNAVPVSSHGSGREGRSKPKTTVGIHRDLPVAAIRQAHSAQRGSV